MKTLSLKVLISFLSMSLFLNFHVRSQDSIPLTQENKVVVDDKTNVLDSSSYVNVKTEEMEGVVVTALGIKREKKSLGYSVQEIKGDAVSESKDANFINSLSGKIAGLDISRNNSMGGSTNVVIRGFKSIGGNNQALFVVDGVPVDNSNSNTRDQNSGRGGYDYGNMASDINPDDVESISVLKGAAATALYGSRASNGVVLISTKKKFQKKGIGVTVSSSFSFGLFDPKTFMTYQDKYGGGDGPAGNNLKNKLFNKFDKAEDKNNDLAVQFTQASSWGAAFDPDLKVYHWDALVPESEYYNKPKPWIMAKNGPSKYFEMAKTINNYVSLENNDDKASFKLSYTNFYQTGIMPNSNLNKNIVYVNASNEIIKGLVASVVGNFVNQDAKGRFQTGYSSKNGNNVIMSFRQWWQTNVDILELKEIYNKTKKNYTWQPFEQTTGSRPYFWDNPYWAAYNNYSTDSRSRFYGNTMLEYKLNRNWNFLARVTFDVYTTVQEERISIGSKDVAKYEHFDKKFNEFNYDGIITYKNTFLDDFDFTGLVGSNIRVQKVNSERQATNGGLILPGTFALTNSKSNILAPDVVNEPQQVNGYFASTSFGYRNFIYLDLTGRMDHSSTLPVSNNLYFYPSASLGFIFSEVLKRSYNYFDWLNLGKLRLNYAMVGNSAPPLVLEDIYSFSDPSGNNNTTFNKTPLLSRSFIKQNSKLKPEQTISKEVGLEMSFLNNRVGFDLALYKVNTINQIIIAPVSLATAYYSKYVNSGEIENKGIEISFNCKPVKSKYFEWSVLINWNKNVNKVISLYEGTSNYEIASLQGGVSINATVGESYGAIKGSDYVYNKYGQKIIDNNGRYEITKVSNITIGNINPDWKGGIRNSFKYKNISFNFLIDIKYGGDIFSLDRWYGDGNGLTKESAVNNELGNPMRDTIIKTSEKTYGEKSGGLLFDGVLMEINGLDTTYVKNYIRADVSTNKGKSSIGYGAFPNKAYIYDASYVKLREIGLSYALVDKYLPSFLQGLSFSLVARNVFIIYKNIPDADPEEGLSSGNIQGYQSAAVPTVREFIAKLTVKF